jgi:osmotically-inducible protein OsmY
MNLHRTLAVLLLAASLSGGVLAQDRVALDDETIFIAVEEALNDARSRAARVRGVTGVSNEIRVTDRPARA